MSKAQPNLNALLRPRSLAVIGASPREGSFSTSLLRSIESLGFGGRIHLVNPRYDEIHGSKCFPSVADIPEAPDCALFALSDEKLVAGLEAAAEAGIRAAVLFGRAYGHLTPNRTIQDALAAIGREAGMSICGANCMGYINLVDRLQVTGMPFATVGQNTRGISLVSHSGSTWSGLVGNQRGIGFDFAVSAGQELVTNVSHYVNFMLGLDSTRVIACVLEKLRDPEGFLEAADRADRKDVPIVVLRLGRSEAGKRFAVSHSGAISGSAAAYEAVFRQHNVIAVRTLDELLDTMELFGGSRRPAGGGLALGTDSGGERQLIVDIAADIGLGFSALSAETTREVQELLDPGMEAANPLDYWGDGGDVMAPCLSALAKDADVDMVIMAANVPPGRPFAEQCADALIAVHQGTDKPVALMGNIATTMSRESAARVRADGVPVLMGTETGLRAVKHFLDYSGRRRNAVGQAAPPAADVGTAERWRRKLASAETDGLTSAEGFELLRDYGLECALYQTVSDEDEVIAFAHRCGAPVVLKIDDPAIPHKSEVGGVFTDLEDEAAIKAAFADLRKRHPRADLLAQRQTSGTELILGMNSDLDFGPIITLGLGGIYTEVFKDVVVLVPPLDEEAVLEALSRLKAFPILQGVRGKPGANLQSIAGAVVRFSRLARDLGGEIAEIEVNPLLVNPEAAVAVDCLVVRERETVDA